MNGSYDFRRPARVTLGSVGPPGQRVFYLQARQDQRLVSLKLEKQQVAFLTGGLREVLADLASATASTDDADLELEEPLEEEWAVGSLELAYDQANDRLVLVASEVPAADDDDDADDDEDGDDPGLGVGQSTAAGAGAAGGAAGPGGAVARFEISRDQAAIMIEEGKRLLRAGRPPCPLCGFPLTEDHSCPKTNGHRAPSP
jgi:uncharacterized repeat protein (TIGR03847 family)